MANKERSCKQCNLKFKPSCGAQKFCCDNCRERFNREKLQLEKRSERKRKNEGVTLAEVNAKAREKGLHYGEYVSRYM